jgi:hypothetical protein
LDRLKKLYFASFPDGIERQAWPGITYFRVRPTWVRFSDFRGPEPATFDSSSMPLPWQAMKVAHDPAAGHIPFRSPILCQLRRTLFTLAPILVRAKKRLPTLEEFQNDEQLNRYFNGHYDKLALLQYGAFQIHFILDSLRRLDALRFEEVMQRVARSSH